jgi:uncharacterized protein
MMATITGLYGAALAVLFVVLSARVILFRRANKVSLGDGGDPDLLGRIRAQGNFAEYAPFGLLLILIAELQGSPALWLHLCGLLLLTGRMMHGVNFSFGLRKMALRVGGMVLTLTALILAAILALPL